LATNAVFAHVKALIQAKKGVVSKVLIFLYFIKVLANITTCKASVYCAKLKHIFNKGYIKILIDKKYSCAVINDLDSLKNPCYYNMNISNNN
jgi:hypothetical protein